MRPLRTSSLLSATFLASLALAAPSPPPPGVSCSITSPSLGRYTLTGLIRPSTDYLIPPSPSTGNASIYLNVCRGVLKETWGVEEPDRVGVYRVKEGEKGESLGRWNDTLRLSEGGVSLVMDEGSICPGTTRRMSSLIAFECAHDVFGTGSPTYIASSPSGCTHFFTFRTPHACPSSYRRGFWHSLWTVFLGALFVFLLYFALAVAYNRLVRGKRGNEQVPPLVPSGEAVERVKEWGTVVVIWVLDRGADLGSVLCGRNRAGTAGGVGWTPASGRQWWEQHPGYHRQHSHSRNSTSTERSPSRGRNTGAGPDGAFALGDDDEQREEARTGRVARFEREGGGAPVPPPKVVVSSPTPSPGRPSAEGPRKVDSLVDT